MEEKMFKITKSFGFCYGHRLFKDTGKCGHLHGHTGKAEIELCSGELDELGMVKNFDELKNSIGRWIEENLDHKVLLNRADTLVEVLTATGEKLYLLDSNPTAENIAKEIYGYAKRSGFPVISVNFWESPTACARYSE